MKTDFFTSRMRLLTLVSSFAAVLLLMIPSLKPNASAVTPQGKGGEVIAKPTPKKPTTPKKVPPRKNSPASRQSSCPAQSPTQATGRRREVTLSGGVSLEMLEIPAGRFCMGSNNGSSDEKPVHQVTLSQPFYMGKYEVTQAQWQSVMGSNPSIFKDCGGNCPVDSVSWDDAQRFINKLNENKDGFRYRLPSEAEWEYACRAGTTTEFAFGKSLSSDQANFDGDYPYGGAAKGVSRKKPIAVGNFAPDTFGLYDMHGNVSEWCEDWYHSSYDGAPSDGSAWLSGGDQKYRVSRGGSFYYDGSALRSASRNALITATYIDCSLNCNGSGFRVVAVPRNDASPTNSKQLVKDPSTKSVDYTRVFAAREVDEQAKILSSPRPDYTEDARHNNVQGPVVLRLVLAASGEVTNIAVVKGLPYGLSEKAIAAARNIKFEPARKDGHQVSQSVQLTFTFSLY